MARNIGRDPKRISNAKQSSNQSLEVKNGSEVLSVLHAFIAHNVHDRYSFGFSAKTRKQIVAYGPWLAALTVLIILPELLVLAKNGSLISVEGFFDEIFFNQDSWVMLIIIFLNTLLFVNGLTYLFNRQRRGWSRVYLAVLLSTLYIIGQLISGSGQLAGTILSLLGALFLLFTLLDIKKYYR